MGRIEIKLALFLFYATPLFISSDCPCDIIWDILEITDKDKTLARISNKQWIEHDPYPDIGLTRAIFIDKK